MSQQTLFIGDGAGSDNTATVTATNQTPGFAIQSLIARYNSSPPTITDGNVAFLQTDVNGNLKTTASVSFTYVANPNSALPTQTAWMGASDGTNLQGLLVESSAAKNLRTSLYYGATELKIAPDGYTAVHQADSPWVVSGTVAVSSVAGTVAVTQSTSPWVVSGTVAATQSGTWTVQQGTPPWSFVGTYATNVAAGSDATKSLVGRYQSSPAAVTDGNLTYLQTDAYGKLLTTATLSPTFVAVPGAVVPADVAWVGGKDGSGNMQGFLVESNTNPNLRAGLYFGATEASITASNGTAGNALQVMEAQYNSPGSATALTGPVDGYSFGGVPVVTTGRVTFAQTDGYGRLEVAPAHAIAYAYENRSSQTVTLKSGAGVLRKMIIGNAGAANALITLYDNTAGSGTIIAKINPSNVLGQLSFDIAFAVGLTYVTNSKTIGDITVTFE